MDIPSKSWLTLIVGFYFGCHAKEFVDNWHNGVGHENNADFRDTAVLNAGIDGDSIGLYAEVHEGRAPDNSENENGSVSDKDKHDLAWEKHNQLIHDYYSYNATASLLELYGCTIYSDEFGIESTASDSAVSSATSTAAYSRIPTDDGAWALFEDAYRFAVGKEPLPRTSEKMQHETQRQLFSASRGIQIPFEVRYDPTIGRSVHATEFVPEGTLIWTDSHVAAFKEDKEEALSSREGSIPELPKYRRFLEYLDNHSTNSSSSSGNGNDIDDAYNWACDALMWTYGADEALCMSFDHGSLFNDAKANKTAATIYSTECQEKSHNNLSEAVDNACLCLNMHAYRDIMPGEELRYDYDDIFSEDDDDEDADDDEYEYADDDDDEDVDDDEYEDADDDEYEYEYEYEYK